MMQKSGQFKSSQGKELFYQSWRLKEKSKATLVLVHGFSDHCNRYANLINGLVPRGLVIYSFDLQGHGQSQGRRGHIQSFEDYREDLRVFLLFVRELESVDSVFLMGHSMGGLIALNYALEYPQNLNGIIASAPHLSDPPVSSILTFLARMLSGIWPSLSMNAGLDASGISRDASVVQSYQDDPLVHGKGTPRLATELSAAVEYTQANAQHFQPPLLIYHGSADKLTSPEASRRFFDNVPGDNKCYITYEGGFHESHNDLHRERVVIDVGQWIEGQIRIKSESQQPQEESKG